MRNCTVREYKCVDLAQDVCAGARGRNGSSCAWDAGRARCLGLATLETPSCSVDECKYAYEEYAACPESCVWKENQCRPLQCVGTMTYSTCKEVPSSSCAITPGCTWDGMACVGDLLGCDAVTLPLTCLFHVPGCRLDMPIPDGEPDSAGAANASMPTAPPPAPAVPSPLAPRSPFVVH